MIALMSDIQVLCVRVCRQLKNALIKTKFKNENKTCVSRGCFVFKNNDTWLNIKFQHKSVIVTIFKWRTLKFTMAEV